MKNPVAKAIAAFLLAIALNHAALAAVAAPAAPVVTSVASRKVHGTAGTFSLALSNDWAHPTIEPRAGPTHTIVFQFDRTVTAGTATVIAGTAVAGSPTFAGNEMTVPLSGVTDAQYVRLAVRNVVATDGGTEGEGAITAGFLLADVNRNGSVSLSDVLLVNSVLAQTVGADNYLFDVNASGTLTLSDKLAANSNLARSIVTAPPDVAADQRKDAARLMRQATFGATRDAILALVAQGNAAWLDEQFGKTMVSHLATVLADPNLPTAPWSVTMPSLWKQMFEGDDQLRQRVAFALSQIYVVSITNETVQNASCGGAAWLDLLNRSAFGNVRDLLRDVTLSPLMGEYLSMKESAKADPVLQTQPDENYAREVMQLFSVGTVMLNLDGSAKLDGNGTPIPTFNQDTVQGVAKALSGWTYAGLDQTKPWLWRYPDLWDQDPVIGTNKACPAWSTPMQPWTAPYLSADDNRVIPDGAHDTGAKQLLSYAGAPYSTLPAGQPAATDLENVVDNLFNHPNVGPFLAKQLIQRMVTSNPSPQYVARVAAKFNDNGSGVRGDMKAVVRAILLDNDARSPTVASQPSFGKLSEPVVRFVQLHRAFNAKRGSHYYDIWNLEAPVALNQSPLHSPSVFNFYSPDYAPAGPLTQAGLVGPEFEITDASSVAGFSDFSKWGIISGFDFDNQDASKWIAPDYSYYLALTSTPTQLVDELDMVLAAGGMNPTVKAAIAQAVAAVVWPYDPAENSRERLAMALWLIINSPDYLVQK